MNEDMGAEEVTKVKCVRCSAEFVAVEVASSSPAPRDEIIGMVIGQLGWRKTFAGWQCPRHD